MENNELEKVTEKYLLAIIKHGDKENPLFKDFCESLPQETEIKLEGSLGYTVGGYGSDYFLLAGTDFTDINTAYFIEHQKDLASTAVFDIKNLSLYKNFRQKGRKEKGEINEMILGKVDKMLNLYESLSNKSPEVLLKQQMTELICKCVKEESLPGNVQTAKMQREQFFKEAGFWRKKTKLAAPTNIAFSLMSANLSLDEKDLGTYVGALNDLKRVD